MTLLQVILKVPFLTFSSTYTPFLKCRYQTRQLPVSVSLMLHAERKSLSRSHLLLLWKIWGDLHPLKAPLPQGCSTAPSCSGPPSLPACRAHHPLAGSAPERPSALVTRSCIFAWSSIKNVLFQLSPSCPVMCVVRMSHLIEWRTFPKPVMALAV